MYVSDTCKEFRRWVWMCLTDGTCRVEMAMMMDFPLLKHPAGTVQETLRHWANDKRQGGSGVHHYLECPHFVSQQDVGVWHHLAVTAQGTDPAGQGWHVYKDGKQLNCKTGSDKFDEPYHADLIGAHSVAHKSTQSSGADKSKYVSTLHMRNVHFMTWLSKC